MTTWIPFLLAFVFLAAQTALILLNLSPSRPYLATSRPQFAGSLQTRRRFQLALSGARRAGGRTTSEPRLCIGGTKGASVRFLSFLPRLCLVGLLMVTGCDEPKQSIHAAPAAKIGKSTGLFGTVPEVRTFRYESHDYVLVEFGETAGGAICHAESCNCRTKAIEVREVRR